MSRDRDTDTQLAAAGWLAVRVWEHEDPGEAALAIEQLVCNRREAATPGARTRLSRRKRYKPDNVLGSSHYRELAGTMEEKGRVGCAYHDIAVHRRV